MLILYHENARLRLESIHFSLEFRRGIPNAQKLESGLSRCHCASPSAIASLLGHNMVGDSTYISHSELFGKTVHAGIFACLSFR